MAISQYYVSPASGNDTTGDGSIGTPWATVQKALNTITRNATDGDQINLQTGGTDTLGAALSYVTYGTPTATAPLIIRGYTSAADDGGIGVISGAGSYAILAGNNDYIHLLDLRLTNVGGNVAVALRHHCSIQGCEIDTGTSRGIDTSGAVIVDRCYIHDFSSFGVYDIGGALISHSHIAACGSYLIALSGPMGRAHRNILKPATAVTAILLNAPGAEAVGNSISGSSGTAKGIEAAASLTRLVCTNNIVQGFSGAGGVGISVPSTCVLAQYHSNAAYNNTTNYSVAAKFLGVTGNNDTLAADPFVDAANGDFSLTTAAKTALRSAGWPSSYLGAHANSDPHITIGAMQYGPTPAASGGGRRPRLWSVS